MFTTDDFTPTVTSRPSAAALFPPRLRDVLGRAKVSVHQNIYEADFEYGPQPLRWEALTAGSGTITHLPGAGGVRMRVTTASGDIALRQSRPYHRYQPGKAMFMSSAVNFGAALAGNASRVGFFDDSNGVFFEQAAPSAGNAAGMGVVFRSDISGTPTDTRIDLTNWNGDGSGSPASLAAVAALVAAIDWTRIQMIWIEYAWYGAGTVRWGVMLNGQPHILHSIGFGNRASQTVPWARTGNLPVRYEQRNTSAISAQNDMTHYGVSVLVEGRADDQRGFTYSYGMAPATPRRLVTTPSTRYPVLSIRGRVMGTQEYTQATSAATGGTTTTLVASGAGWTADQWKGRCVYLPAAPMPTLSSGTSNASSVGSLTYASAHGLFPGQLLTLSGVTPSGWNGTWVVLTTPTATTATIQLATNAGTITIVGTGTYPCTARITTNTSTTLTLGDVITGSALPAALTSGLSYTIGLINRGQLLPRQLLVSSDALGVVEIVASTPNSPIILTGASFAAMNTLGSANSFAERDVSATAMTGGEVVMAFTAPLGGSGLQQIDLSNLFPILNTIRGNIPDILTVALTTGGGNVNIGAHLICQEAMS